MTISEIQQQITSYLAGEQSFEEFEDWLVKKTRFHYLDNPETVRSILGKVHYLMFQLIENEIDESRFKIELQSLPTGG